MGRKRKKDVFKSAVDAAEHLEWEPGLQAIRAGEGKGQITAADPKLVRGSVYIDGDCKKSKEHAQAHVWDYVVGLRRTATHAIFIEVHSAETSEVSKIADKLTWLRDFLQREAQAALRALPHEYHWVASGGVHIPKNTPQYRWLNSTLRAQGLQGPVKHLTLA